MKLLFNAFVKLIFGIFIIALLLFLPAGSIHYPGAWIFLGLLFLPMTIMGIFLFVKSPELLKKRLNVKEKEKTQRGVISLLALAFPTGFIISALDFRFNWSSVPLWLTITASALFLIGYALYAEVMRENAYLSRTVEVVEDQNVIDTGLYSIVRHPMYLATLFMFVPIALILGSFFGLIPFAVYPVAIIIRIFNEEKLLSKELFGYEEYKKRVKYRLIPFIF